MSLFYYFILEFHHLEHTFIATRPFLARGLQILISNCVTLLLKVVDIWKRCFVAFPSQQRYALTNFIHNLKNERE